MGADFMLHELAVVEKQIIPALHNLNSNASGVGKKITPEILRGLDGCAYALSMSDAEPALDRNKLADIRRELDELADKLAHADDLDPDLRAFLADAISALIREIDDVDLFGPGRLRKALERAIGGLQMYGPKLPENEQPSILRRLRRLLGLTADVFGVAGFAMMLGAAPVPPALAPGPQRPPGVETGPPPGLGPSIAPTDDDDPLPPHSPATPPRSPHD